MQINLSTLNSSAGKSFMQVTDNVLLRIFMAKKPKTAEEQKKKVAYYSKKEKKAKEVKK
jgi:hypothetical protein